MVLVRFEPLAVSYIQHLSRGLFILPALVSSQALSKDCSLAYVILFQMAKLAFPLLSHAARGSIGKTLTYLVLPVSSRVHEKCPYQSVVQKYHEPSSPPSEEQENWKQTFSSVAHSWKTLTPEEKETWEILGKKIRKDYICGMGWYLAVAFDLFMAYNLIGVAAPYAWSAVAPTIGSAEWSYFWLKHGINLAKSWKILSLRAIVHRGDDE